MIRKHRPWAWSQISADPDAVDLPQHLSGRCERGEHHHCPPTPRPTHQRTRHLQLLLPPARTNETRPAGGAVSNVSRLPTPPGPPGGGIPQPHDTNAEKQVLGAMLQSPRAALAIIETSINGHDFWTPTDGDIYDAIATRALTGQPIDPTLIADDLGPDLDRTGGLPYLHELIAGCITPANATWHADIIRARADERDTITAAATLITNIANRGDTPLADIITTATQQLAAVPAKLRPTETPGETIDDLLAGDDEDDEYDWLINGFLERRDRLILTAGEGAGKSTLIRQWAVQAAAGIHPTTGHTTDPIRVLLIDLENSRRQTRRKIRALRDQAGNRLDPSRLIVHCKTDGLDLTTPTDQAWLDQMVTYHRPDLLITGPIYKMAGGNPNDEQESKPVAMALDKLRETHDIAVILEAHSRKGEGGKHRPKEPFGWSGWMRWPEFGIHLGDEGELTHWRGMRDERTFPHQLNRGGVWPWSPMTSLADQRIAQIKDAIRTAGRRLSIRELADITGLSKSAVDRLLKEHSYEIERVVYDVEPAPEGDD